MKNEEYVGKWLYYPWLKGSSDENLIHPDDRQIIGIGIVQCIGVENEYILLRNKNSVIRGKVIGSNRILPSPKFVWRDKVYEVKRDAIVCIIDDLFWHFKDAEYKYLITINGKRKSKQLDETELQHIKEDISLD